jgi:hypothetical protein
MRAYAGLRTEEPELSGTSYTLANQIIIVTAKAVRNNKGLISSAETRCASSSCTGIKSLRFDAATRVRHKNIVL